MTARSSLGAVAAPLGVVGLASALWWISDRLLYIGPIDRATFGWLVVVPIWATAPLAAGFAWRRLKPGARTFATTAYGVVVGAVVALLLWQDVAFPDCPTGPARTPAEWSLPAIMLGVVVGGGFGLSGLLASGLVREGHPWRAFAFGAATQVAVVVIAITLASVLLFGVCARPR